MHARSGATGAAAGVALLRILTGCRGWACIWIALEGLDLGPSELLGFPSRATGARGFHIWLGEAVLGARAEEKNRKGENPMFANKLSALTALARKFYLKATNRSKVIFSFKAKAKQRLNCVLTKLPAALERSLVLSHLTAFSGIDAALQSK